MKKTIFVKRIRFVPVLLACIIAVTGFSGTTRFALAAETSVSRSIEEQILDVCKYQCYADGIELTDEEEKNLMNEICETICNYADESGCTYGEAGESILSEIIMETGYGTQPDDGISLYSSSGTGKTQLPASVKGYIFFTDNNAAWNHVGMYTASNRIVEAMPDCGVHEVLITDPTALQKTTGEIHDQSCILMVSGITSTQIAKSVDWALDQVNKPYDYNFINNKTNTTSSNAKFNCSELVWKSFKFSADIDLDSNGGLAVYPNNIYNSSKVKQVRYF